MIRANDAADKAPPKSLLVTDVEVGQLLGVARRTVHRLRSQGLLPQTVKIPGTRLTRWRRADIVAFVEAGCDLDAMETAE